MGLHAVREEGESVRFRAKCFPAVAAGLFMLAACTSAGTTAPSRSNPSTGNPSSTETATPLPGRIAFTDLPKAPGHYLVYTIAPDGGARTPVTTPPPAADDQHARFSPDGSQ